MKRSSWGWLLSIALLAAVSINASAQHGRGHGRHRESHNSDRSTSAKRDLAQKVYRVTSADSVQKTKMKPVIDKTSKRLEALRLNYQKQEKRVLDSLSLQLKPYLKEDQMSRLNEWKDKTGRK